MVLVTSVKAAGLLLRVPSGVQQHRSGILRELALAARRCHHRADIVRCVAFVVVAFVVVVVVESVLDAVHGLGCILQLPCVCSEMSSAGTARHVDVLRAMTIRLSTFLARHPSGIPECSFYPGGALVKQVLTAVQGCKRASGLLCAVMESVTATLARFVPSPSVACDAAHRSFKFPFGEPSTPALPVVVPFFHIWTVLLLHQQDWLPAAWQSIVDEVTAKGTLPLHGGVFQLLCWYLWPIDSATIPVGPEDETPPVSCCCCTRHHFTRWLQSVCSALTALLPLHSVRRFC